MATAKIITALCTPLQEDEQLHLEGLELHIQDQLRHGIDGLLIGGTMGAMQLLTDSVYLESVQHSIQFNAGQAELLVGVGDTSFVRTRDRIRQVENLEIDGVVIISPFFLKFRQQDLIDYFQALADLSSKPVFLYDLPGTTGTKLAAETVLTLLQHPNIAGIKCSDHIATTRPILDAVPDQKRVIVAQPTLVDMLVRSGVEEHLDGVFGLVPHWMEQLKQAAQAENWDEMTEVQGDLSELLKCLLGCPAPVLSAANEILRLRGIPGKIAPAPMPVLTEAQREQFAEASIVQKAIQHRPAYATRS